MMRYGGALGRLKFMKRRIPSLWFTMNIVFLADLQSLTVQDVIPYIIYHIYICIISSMLCHELSKIEFYGSQADCLQDIARAVFGLCLGEL